MEKPLDRITGNRHQGLLTNGRIEMFKKNQEHRRNVKYTGDGAHAGKIVFVMGRAGEDEEDDYWKVRTENGSQFVAGVSDLQPRPDEPETNVEFITAQMDWSPAGPLIQAFVIEGLAKYAEQVQNMPADQRASMDSGFISYAAWRKCADEYLAAINERH